MTNQNNQLPATLPWRTVEIPAEESELGARDFATQEGIPHHDLYATVADFEVERSEPGILVAHADMSKPRNINVACIIGEPENVAYIAMACNALPALRRSLEAFLDLCPRMSEDDPIAPALADACRRARALLRPSLESVVASSEGAPK